MFASRLRRTLRVGFKSLWLHKLRSILTMLGVIFGVCSVIAMLAIGEGASQQAQDQIRQLGSQNIIINSVRPPEDQSAGAAQTFTLAYGLTYLDAERIKSSIPNIEVIVPTRNIRQHIMHFDRRIDGDIIGTVPWYPDVTNRTIGRGRFLQTMDMASMNMVCVLNEAAASALFPFDDPLGGTVRAGRNCFQVVGILRGNAPDLSKLDGAPPQRTSAYEVFVPITTVRSRYGDTIMKRRTGSFETTRIQLDQILVKASSVETVMATSKAIERILSYAHPKKDCAVVVPLELLEKARKMKRTFSIVLGSIAAISLLVGGIGIMNIMLATVTERTREIGIRRALGARRRDIITQFLSEATLLSATGGLLGVGLGPLIPRLVSRFYGMPTIVTLESVLLAFSISAATGLLFGTYPAHRAAIMDPIEALRHE